MEQTKVDQIEIVEYHSGLAAAVADMWNNSMEGWGGSNNVFTEEQVRDQEANSSNLHLYIAFDGEKAVGYCGLSEYSEDAGALYIPLLNVRDAYHGKKIGKKLLLTALQKTIELGWPRLDLYTWPGNTKAVPLYKKCGFFWEDRDDTTHLMNFLPTVLATETIADFFNTADWYDDSTRMIEVKPDGRQENDSEFYEYSWRDNENRFVRVEIEKTGRGIRLIETDDYFISATVENPKPVAGSNYSIRYDVKNKSNQPLTVSFEGQDDKNITFDYNDEVTVDGQTCVKATYHVGKIDEEQNEYKTHPAVVTKMKINGKEAVFKTGVSPQFPANVSCQLTGTFNYTDTPSQFYLELKNNFNEEATFSFKLDDESFMKFEKRAYQISVDAKGKASIPIAYVLSEFGHFSQQVVFKATTQNGQSQTFTKNLTAGFKGHGAMFSGESDKHWQIYNGEYHVTLDKSNNELRFGRNAIQHSETFFFFPKLGKPFSDEFSKVRPEQVAFEQQGSTITMKAEYVSTAFNGLSFVSHAKLYASGLLEQWYDVKNVSDQRRENDVWLYHPVFHDLHRAVLPYDGDYIGLDDHASALYMSWKANKLTENWLFARDNVNPRGICWSSDAEIHFEMWFLSLEYNLGKLKAGETVSTKPIYVSFGAYQTWQDFRAFAQKQANTEPLLLSAPVQLSVNKGNPVIKDDFTAEVNDMKSTYLNGDVTVHQGKDEVARKQVTTEEKLSSIAFHIPSKTTSGIDLIRANGQSDAFDLDKEAIVLNTSANAITFEKTSEHGFDLYRVNNGPVDMTTAPGYFPSLYSMKINGEERLANAFPNKIAKAWWNPWAGGIAGHLRGLGSLSFLKEQNTADFAELTDNQGNRWQGVKITTTVSQHAEFKGLTYTQYYVTLPGIPVVCHTTEIIQNTHRYFDTKKWYVSGFMNADSIHTSNESGIKATYYTGKSELELEKETYAAFGIKNSPTVQQVVYNSEASNFDIYANKEVTCFEVVTDLNMAHGARQFTSPVFFLFHDSIIPEHALHDLKRLSFSKR